MKTKIRDRLEKSGIRAEHATVAQILSAIGKPDNFDVKKSEVGADIANLVAYVDVNHAELARRLGWKPSRVSRVLSGKENLTLRTVNEIASSIDYEFDVIFRKHEFSKPDQPWVREQYENYVESLKAQCTVHLIEAKRKSQEAEAILKTAQQLSRRLFQKNTDVFSSVVGWNVTAANEGQSKNETFTAAA